MSSSSRPWSSASLKATLSTPSWTSFKSIMRESSSGPISETVARTGWPCSPNTSQNTVENWSGWNASPISAARLTIKSLASPVSEMPERSPLMSAANTGTPARANPSAITCSETVLPVPVAPVTRPCRLASASVSQAGSSPLPMKIFSSVSAILSSDGAIASPLRAHRGSPDHHRGLRPIIHRSCRMLQADCIRSTAFGRPEKPLQRNETCRTRSIFRRKSQPTTPLRQIISKIRAHACKVATLDARSKMNRPFKGGHRL